MKTRKASPKIRRRVLLAAACVALVVTGLVGATECGVTWPPVGVGRYEFTLKPWLPYRAYGPWRTATPLRAADTWSPTAVSYVLWLTWYDYGTAERRKWAERTRAEVLAFSAAYHGGVSGQRL